MTGTQRKQYEMLQRVREFGNTSQKVLSTSAVATELLAAVNTAIEELTQADMKKLSASGAARAGRKREARRALVGLLQKAGQLAKVLRAEGRPMPPCEFPASKSDQALLTAGRQLVLDAVAFAADFDGHAMASAHIAGVTAAFEAAAADQDAGRAQHIAARAHIDRLLRGAQRQVRRLDLIVDNVLTNDEAALAVWTQARRIQEARGTRAADEPAATTPETSDTPPADTVA